MPFIIMKVMYISKILEFLRESLLINRSNYSKNYKSLYIEEDTGHFLLTKNFLTQKLQGSLRQLQSMQGSLLGRMMINGGCLLSLCEVTE